MERQTKRGMLIVLCMVFALSDIAQPVKMHGRLKVVGTQLMDEHNQPYALHGMSLGWSCWWPRFFTAGTVDWLYRDWNCSVIRAAMAVEPKGGYEDDPAGSRKLIETVVDAAIKSGIYVIIDWHGDHLKAEEAKNFFSAMASKYARYPNVIYEVFNEPTDKDSWPEVKVYAEAVIKVIRERDPYNLILVGCPRWDQELQLPAADPIKGYANLMYTMHFYAGTHKQWLRDRTDAAIKTGLPVFISESGGMEHTGDGPIDYKEWQAYIDWINKNNLSWISWAVIDKNETDAVVYPAASSTGHWRESDLTAYGAKIREYLRGYPPVSHGQ
jgi:endoglucanase